LRVPDAARQQATQTLLEAGTRPHAARIAVGAGASYGSAKCWPPDRFAKALNSLLSHADADVILFGTPSELPVSTAIASELQRPSINLTGKTSIADLPALLSQCHIFLGNDSGAMHVAAAVGLPVVAVFGPTDPDGTAPVTPRVTIVQQKPYCSPCFLRRCPTDHRCMTAVTPAMVESALQSALAEVPSA
jgi:heptosyltransferase II